MYMSVMSLASKPKNLNEIPNTRNYNLQSRYGYVVWVGLNGPENC